MRYFTKEWYQAMQDTGLHHGLTVDHQADVFSEQYFQQLYAAHIKRKAWQSGS